MPLKRSKEEIQKEVKRVEELYTIICNKPKVYNSALLESRANIIRELERLTRQGFVSTSDFHKKVNSWLLSRKFKS